MWLIKRCHSSRESFIFRLWGRGLYPKVCSSSVLEFRARVPRLNWKSFFKNESCWGIRYKKWLNEAFVQCQYILWLLTVHEYIWPTTNNDDEINDDWLDDCYDEEYVPSSVYEFRVRDWQGKCWAVDGGILL